MLHGALGQVLPLGNRLRLGVALHDDTADTALAQLYSQPHAHRARDDYICILVWRLCLIDLHIHLIFLLWLAYSAVMPWVLMKLPQRGIGFDQGLEGLGSAVLGCHALGLEGFGNFRLSRMLFRASLMLRTNSGDRHLGPSKPYHISTFISPRFRLLSEGA